MARYHTVPDEMKVKSEHLEPTFAIIIGRLFAQAIHAKEKFGPKNVYYVDALESLWQATEAMQRLSTACLDTVHATLALSNNQSKIDRWIEADLGFSPILKHKELKTNSFRNLVNFDLEFNFREYNP